MISWWKGGNISISHLVSAGAVLLLDENYKAEKEVSQILSESLKTRQDLLEAGEKIRAWLKDPRFLRAFEQYRRENPDEEMTPMDYVKVYEAETFKRANEADQLRLDIGTHQSNIYELRQQSKKLRQERDEAQMHARTLQVKNDRLEAENKYHQRRTEEAEELLTITDELVDDLRRIR